MQHVLKQDTRSLSAKKCRNESGKKSLQPDICIPDQKCKRSNLCKAGYTGDMYCKDCGEKISSGEVIAKAHTWDEGNVTKEADCKEMGVKTYTPAINAEQQNRRHQ